MVDLPSFLFSSFSFAKRPAVTDDLRQVESESVVFV